MKLTMPEAAKRWLIQFWLAIQRKFDYIAPLILAGQAGEGLQQDQVA
jgi:hypothetical protein